MKKELISISNIQNTFYRGELYAIDVKFNYDFYKTDFKGEINIRTNKELSEEEIKDKIIEVVG